MGRVRVGVRGFVVMVMVSVMYYADESPHKDRRTRMCVCVVCIGILRCD